MKKLTALILAVLLLSGCAQTYDGPTTTELVLAEYEVVYTPWEGFDPTINRTTFAYDIYGNRVITRDYRDGELTSEVRAAYDENGNELSCTYWNHTKWIPYPEQRTETTYDDQGRILTDVTFDLWGRETDRTEYTYDDEARTTTVTYDGGVGVSYYDERGLLLRYVKDDYESVNTYDENGNRIAWHTYDAGVPGEYNLTTYDDQGREIYTARYLADGTLDRDWEYVYDDENHTMTQYKPNGTRRVEYYDADGRCLSIEDYDEDGRMTMTQTYFYREIKVPVDGEESP